MKNLQEILKEIMKVGKKSPGEWKSISAPTRDHTGSDLLLFHPTAGPVFQIRAYERNPYQLQGVGTRLSQSVDNDFLKLIDKKTQQGNLGLLDLNYKILEQTIKDGGKIDKIFLNALLGKKNEGIDFLNLGNSYHRPQEPLPLITDQQKKLDKEYKRIVRKDGKNSMYG